MFYHPNDYATGFREVIAAWLFCLAVAATGFAYAEVSADPEDRAAEVHTAPQRTPSALQRTAICAARDAGANSASGPV